MSAFTKTIPEPLHTFVKPQIDQLALSMEPIHCGMVGKLRNDLGEGFLWTAPIGSDCLISLHRIQLNSSILLQEEPTDFSCIFSGSRATVLSSPELKIPAYQERENLAVFSQEGGTSECILEANSLYESTSITFRPEFLDKLKTTYSGDLDVIINKMESTKPTIPPKEVRTILRSFNPQRACLPGASLYFHAKILETIGFLSAQENAESPEQFKQLPINPVNSNELPRVASAQNERNLIVKAYNKTQEKLLVEQAQSHIHNHLSEHLTIEKIANNVYVSRSYLCKAFKDVLGVGVAEYIRTIRIQTASKLLQNESLSINEVAQRVGYNRTSTFSEAFHQSTGLTPTEWRTKCLAKWQN